MSKQLTVWWLVLFDKFLYNMYMVFSHVQSCTCTGVSWWQGTTCWRCIETRVPDCNRRQVGIGSRSSDYYVNRVESCHGQSPIRPLLGPGSCKDPTQLPGRDVLSSSYMYLVNYQVRCIVNLSCSMGRHPAPKAFLLLNKYVLSSLELGCCANIIM